MRVEGVAVFPLARRSDNTRAKVLFILLLTDPLIFALYQTRFYGFGQLFAILPLALLAARIHAGAAGPSVPRLAYVAVLLLAAPFLWGLAGRMIAPPKAPAAPSVAAA